MKNSFGSIKFNSKKVFNTIAKHSSILEKFISKMKREKMQEKISQELELSDYKKMLKNHNEERKLKKEIIDLEEDEFKIK